MDSVPFRRNQFSNENPTVRCRTFASELLICKAIGASKIIMRKKKNLFTMFIVSNQNLILRPHWDIIRFDHRTQRNETGTGKDVSSCHSTRSLFCRLLEENTVSSSMCLKILQDKMTCKKDAHAGTNAILVWPWWD